MNLLIQSKSLKQFLTATGGWTNDLREAVHFTNSSLAQSAIFQLRLIDAEVYYSFEEFGPCEYDFTIPFCSGLMAGEQ